MLAAAAAAAMLSVSGVVLRLWSHGAAARSALAVLVIASIIGEVGLRRFASGARVQGAVAAAAWLALLLASVVPVVGRAPAVLSVAMLLVADGALLMPSPLGMLGRVVRDSRSGSQRPATRVAPVGVAMLGLGAATFFFAHSGATISAVAAVVLAAGAVVAHRSRVRAVLAADRAVAAAVAAIVRTIGTVALSVVALPTLWIPGWVARVVRSVVRPSRWDAPVSNWSETRSDPDRRIADARAPFSSSPRRVRVRNNVMGLVVLVVIAVGAASLMSARTQEERRRSDALLGGASTTTVVDREVKAMIDAVEATPYSSRPAFEGTPFADALQEELGRMRLVPGPVGDYGLADFSGTHTNVTGGVRSTIEPDCDGCRPATVWLVGGSAVFGMGQRDSHTIASELVRLGDADRIALDVVNLGVPGRTLWQEYQAVLARLASNAPRPDLVVFVDGYNDVVGTLASTTVDGPRSGVPTVMDPNTVIDFFGLLPQLGDEIDGRALGALMAEKYRSLQRLIERQLAAEGIDSAFYFQPDALTSDRQRAPVEALYAGTPLADVLDALEDALAEASARLEPGTVNLRALLAAQPSPVFADSVHMNELGARLTAEALFPSIRTRLGQSS